MDKWVSKVESQNISVCGVTIILYRPRPRVLRVLARIAADLDELARSPLPLATSPAEENGDPRARHRRRLAEPEPTPRRQSVQEERAALREALGLSPYTKR